MSDLLVQMIKHHEGTGPVENGNLMPYRDSKDLLTIGYGTCIELTGLRPHEALYLLKSRISETKEECRRNFKWFAELNEARKAVIISMIYNMGLPKFMGFKKTIGYLTVGDFASASIEMLDSKWSKQVGSRADVLAEIMKTGEW